MRRLAVAAILMGLGMVMLSPPIISLPCKLLTITRFINVLRYFKNKSFP